MDQDKRTEKLHSLDMKCQGVSHQTDLLVKDEEARRLEVRIVMQRDTISDLQDQITQMDNKISQLAVQRDDFRIQLDSANDEKRGLENQVRVQAREQSNLKTELLSLNGVTQDSAKILSEKLALSRELSLLKPEVEHLRSQLNTHKELLSEKLALERQLNTLEVELANEKRAVQRATQKQETQDQEAEEELRQQIHTLEKKLANEKRATQRAKEDQERNEAGADEDLRQRVDELEKLLAAEKRTVQRIKAEKSSAADGTEAELQRKMHALEKKLADETTHRKESEQKLAQVQAEKDELAQSLENLKTKLKEARAEVKSVKKGLATAQQGPIFATEEELTKKLTTKAQARRKRRANEISEDEAPLHSPTNMDAKQKRPLKKRGLEHTLVGEKSMFSITPFLNKTISFADNSIEFTAGGGGLNFNKGRSQERPSTPEIDTSGDSIVVGEEAPVSTALPEPTVTVEVTRTTKVPLKAPRARGRPAKTSSSSSNILGEISASKKNLKPLSSRKAALSEPTLHRVMEEEADDDPSTEQENRSSETTTAFTKDLTALTAKMGSSRTSGASASSQEAEPKKKKRKLLGGGGGASKTIFGGDEEAVAEVAAAAVVAPPPTKRAKTFASSSKATAKRVVGLTKTAFGGGGFSPLKRERRGVNASFLG